MEIGINNKIPARLLPEFRFWHIGRQKMYIVDYFTRDGQLIWWPGPDATLAQWDEACSDQIQLADGVLMQFTGLVDCNGAKVWEGDIVYDTFQQESVEGGLLHSYCYVVFVRGGFGLVAGLGGVDLEPFNGNCCIDDNPIEAPIGNRVVGNIYQHRGLLIRDYYNANADSSTGMPPDEPQFYPESVYTYAPEAPIGTIDGQSNLSPSHKNLICPNMTVPLLPH